MPSRASHPSSLSFSTRELHFNVRKQTCTVTLSNPHTKHIAYKIKVKPTALEKYVVAPSMDIVKPGASIDITVRINGVDSRPRARRSTQEKLLVQCCVLEGDEVTQSAHSTWKNLPRHDSRVIERKLVAKFEDYPLEEPIPEEEEPTEVADKDTPRATTAPLPEVNDNVEEPDTSTIRDPFAAAHAPIGGEITTPTIKLSSSFDSSTLLPGRNLKRSNSSDSLSSTADSVASSTMSTSSYITIDEDGRSQTPPLDITGLSIQVDPFEDPRPQTPTLTDRASLGRKSPSPARRPSPQPSLRGGCYVKETTMSRWVDFIPADHRKRLHHCRFKKTTQTSYYNGGFSQVWTCETFSEGSSPMFVAAKELKMFNVVERASMDGRLVLQKLLSRLQHEVSVWMRLSHPNIAPLIGYSFQPELYLISPWYEKGHVRKFVTKTNPDRRTRLNLAKGVISGIKYLHDRDIIHGDIKSDNILVSDEHEAVIIDFGLSEAVDDEFQLTVSISSSAAGHCRWQAPEVLQNEKKTKESDIFAIGCVILEIFTGELPYRGHKDMPLLFMIAKGSSNTGERVLPGTPAECPNVTQDIWNLIQPCWEEDPQTRPKIQDLYDIIRVLCSEQASR